MVAVFYGNGAVPAFSRALIHNPSGGPHSYRPSDFAPLQDSKQAAFELLDNFVSAFLETALCCISQKPDRNNADKNDEAEHKAVFD